MKRYWHGYIQPGPIATAHLAGWAKGWVGSVSRGRMGERCQRAVKWWQPQCTVRHGCTFHGMKRVDKVWDVPGRQTVHVDLVDTLSSVKQACRDLRLRVEACNIAASVVNSSLLFSEHSFLRRTQEVYKEYTADMVLEEGEVLVPDDRQKKLQAHEAISAARHVLDKCSRMSRKHSVTVLRNKRISFLAGDLGCFVDMGACSLSPTCSWLLLLACSFLFAL